MNLHNMHAIIRLTIAIVIILAVSVTSIIFPESPGALYSTNDISSTVVRIGYFPNINHAQAVIGINNNTFQDALGDNIQVKSQIFNAGPSVIDALFADRIDIAYIGPNPAINGFVVSDGKELRIVAGASSGGAVFVVRNDAGINSPHDLEGKRLATPQLGNTQDVALRKYLLSQNLKTVEQGGSIQIIPVKPSDIYTLMLKKQIDGAWVPEPWGARLIREADAKIMVDERDLWPNGDFITSQIIVDTRYLEKNPEIVSKIINSHIDITNWINNNKDRAIDLFNKKIKEITGSEFPEQDLKESFSRIEFTHDPIADSLIEMGNDAFEIGYLDKKPDLDAIYNLEILNSVLVKKGLLPV